MRVDQLDLLVLRHRHRDRFRAREHLVGGPERPRRREPAQEPRRALEQRRDGRDERRPSAGRPGRRSPSAAAVCRHRVRREQQRDVIAPPDVDDRQVDGEPPEERGLILARRASNSSRYSPAVSGRSRRSRTRPSAVGQGLRHPDRRGGDVEPVERDADALGRHRRARYRGRGSRSSARRWTDASSGLSGASANAILRSWLICRSVSATSTLPPAGSRPPRKRSRRSGCSFRSTPSSSTAAGPASRPGSRSATSGPASTTRTTPRIRRPGQLAIYPGGISECEIFFPYGGCTTASKVGQLAANHFATVEPDEGWADRLREMGRRCLWEGAQDISIREG